MSVNNTCFSRTVMISYFGIKKKRKAEALVANKVSLTLKLQIVLVFYFP